MGIKNRIYQKKMLHAIRYNDRKVIFPEMETIETVTFLIDEQTTWDNVRYCDAIKRGMKAVVISVCSGKRGTSETTLDLFSDDINWYGIPKKTWFNHANLGQTDILVNLTNGLNQSIEYICAASKAKFKIGKKPNGELYDLVINMADEDNDRLIVEIVKIMKNLKSIH